MVRWIMMMAICLTTSGCLGNFSLSDLATGGGAVIGAGASAALSAEPTLVVLGTAIGATAGAAVVGTHEETVVDQLSAVPEDQRADALKWLTIVNTLKEWGMWAIAATLAFFLIPLLIGYFIPNGEHRKMKRKILKDLE